MVEKEEAEGWTRIYSRQCEAGGNSRLRIQFDEGRFLRPIIFSCQINDIFQNRLMYSIYSVQSLPFISKFFQFAKSFQC